MSCFVSFVFNEWTLNLSKACVAVCCSACLTFSSTHFLSLFPPYVYRPFYHILPEQTSEPKTPPSALASLPVGLSSSHSLHLPPPFSSCQWTGRYAAMLLCIHSLSLPLFHLWVMLISRDAQYILVWCCWPYTGVSILSVIYSCQCQIIKAHNI